MSFLRKFHGWMIVLLVAGAFSQPLLAQSQSKRDERARQEEQEDYFKKWLNEDVKYIIADEERAVFEKLTTPEERENFIEQFWLRRDPDPRTSANEFKAEHYRRIAYVNERFRSGKPGWMTDRGRVYIIHGEPSYIERHPSGGSYTRTNAEGSGQSFAYPFEVWYYRFVDAIGDTMELEFVDPSFSGEYRLALRPEEKDMLLYVPGTAPTVREVLGKDTGRKDRPFFNPGIENNPLDASLRGYRTKDRPFARYTRYAMSQAAPDIKFDDLKQIVTTNITYHDLPARLRTDLIRLNEKQVLAPITVEVNNQDLNFRLQNGLYRADLNIYGVIRTMTGRIISEFEDTVVAEYRPEHIERGQLIKSVYQRVVVLEQGHRFRTDIVVRDKNSNRTSVLQSGLAAPEFETQKGLQTSSLILSRFVEAAPDAERLDERFVLGDLKIIPNVTNEFRSGEGLHAYIQVYNVPLDQAALVPHVEVRYRLSQGGNILREFQDNTGFSIQYFSEERVVLLHEFKLRDLEPGVYQLDIEVHDLISDATTSAREKFTITEKQPADEG